MSELQFICRLEDTLIDMFLSGYSNQTTYAAASDMSMPVETNGLDNLNVSTDGWYKFLLGDWSKFIAGFVTSSCLSKCSA